MIVWGKGRARALWIVVQSLFVGCLACGIVNFAIDRALSWSLIVLGGSALTLLALFPALCIRPRPLLFALLGVSLGIIPYLWLIGYGVGDSSWCVLGSIIAALSILYAWFCYLLLVLGKSTIVTRSGYMVAGAGLLSFAIDWLVGDGLFWPLFNLILLCAIGVVMILRGGGPRIKVGI